MLNTDQIPTPVAEAKLCCFHCGQPVPLGVPLTVQMDGQARPVCCIGCQAVSQAIIGGGLTDYYRRREAFPDGAVEDFRDQLAELGLYDHEDFQKTFVRPVADGEREADLILEGISCAACVWLNERHLRSQNGVVAVHVNYATRRAKVRWREKDVRLSQILAAIVAIGYRAYPFDSQRFEEAARAERRIALQRLFVAGLGMMQVMMYAYPAYIATDGEMTVGAANIMRWASFVLTVPVILYSAQPFFLRAWRGLRYFHFGMDFPVALGIGLSFLASVWATLTGRGEVYFDSVTMFVFFLLAGRYLEMHARQRAARMGDSLGRVVPQFARRVSASGGVEEQVPASSLSVGDLVVVRPGEVVVVDGKVCSGVSEVDESWLTGESVPVPKNAGALVLSGSLNGSGSLVIETTQIGDSTQLASVRRLIERASEDRPGVVILADSIATHFTWILLGLAIGAAIWWWHENPVHALPVLVSVLVVSCPCALSLATPVSMTVATHLLASKGVLVTRAHAIETLAHTQHFVFDKTGTLTTGRLKLRDVVCVPGIERKRALEIAAALELHSEHSIARVLVAHADEASCASEACVFPGKGVEGTVGDIQYVIGNEAFVRAWSGRQLPDGLVDDESVTRVFLASESAWLAAFSFADGIRREAAGVIAELKSAGCDVSILSGDGFAPASAVAEDLGISDVRAGLLPDEKRALMQQYQSAGKTVVMVGDGINDAPVLAQAHVSVAMAGGTELARNQADILLLNDDLSRLVWARRAALKTMQIVRQNLAWAFAYNLAAIPAAMMGLVPPWLAGLGMGLSSLLVVLNALRISRKGGLWKAVSTY